jgi:beta-lactamase regulating signal transducer with metallopeptidase domain
MNAVLHGLAPYYGAVTALVDYFFDTLWMGAVIAALTAVVLRWWKPLDAAARYAVWCVALLAVAIGPLATVAVQHWHDPLLVTISVRQQSVASAVDTYLSGPAPVLHAPLGIALPDAVGLALIVVWLTVASIGFARVAAGAFALSRLKRDALPLSPDLRDGLALWRARSDAAGPLRTRLCVSDRVDVPVAVGLFDRMVVIPDHLLDAFEPADIDRFVLHELAHIERRDDWTALAQRVVQTMLFFNPAVHFIARLLDLEREIACDDRVVTATHDVRSYAAGLTRMAESTAWPHHGLATPAIFVTRKQLSLRVEQLLATGRIVTPRVALAPAMAVLAVSACIVAVAAPFSPSFAAAPRGGQIKMSTAKVVVIQQEHATTPGRERHSVFYLQSGPVEEQRVYAATPEQMSALIKELAAKKRFPASTDFPLLLKSLKSERSEPKLPPRR